MRKTTHKPGPSSTTIPAQIPKLGNLQPIQKPPAHTSAQRQATYRAAQKAKGFTWVGFWLDWAAFTNGKATGMDPATAGKSTVPEDMDPVSWVLGFQTGLIARTKPDHPALITTRIRPPKFEDA